MSREEKVDVNIGPVNIHIYQTPPEKDQLRFDVGPEFDLPSKSVTLLEGFFVSYQLKDNKGLHLKLQGKSMHGNPVDFKNEEVVVTSSDDKILTVTEDTGVISVTPVGVLGTAQVQVSVPGVLVSGVALSGTFDVEVIGGDVVSIQFTPADTFDIPPATPVPAPAP